MQGSEGYRVCSYDRERRLWFYTDETTKKNATSNFEQCRANKIPCKLQKVTTTIEDEDVYDGH